MVKYMISIYYEVMTRHSVPWNYPNLSNKTTTTSPFTIIFKEAGSSTRFVYRLLGESADTHSAVAASFMNTVILTSVLSAGNHALFAGTRVLYGKNFTDAQQSSYDLKSLQQAFL